VPISNKDVIAGVNGNNLYTDIFVNNKSKMAPIVRGPEEADAKTKPEVTTLIVTLSL
jgi:hypothetical protein